MSETAWQQARLIPVSGISGTGEQECRGTSALLAVLESVNEFGRSILGGLGAPSGQLSTYIEVTFELNGAKVRPDGLIRVTRGSRVWTALVEVKTSRNELRRDQVEAYLDVANAHGFDAVLTISNQLVAGPGEHPAGVDNKRLKKVALHHLSWSQIHTAAVMERVNRSISDPDQAWILGELIRYLEHEKSGAVDFDDMGPSWVAVRDAVMTRALRPNDPTAADVVARFGQLISFAGMRLSRRLGVSVQPAITRGSSKDLGARLQAATNELATYGTLSGSLRIPNAAATLDVLADLRSGLVTCSMSIAAPSSGRNTTRVNWLVRQLSKAPEAVNLEAWAAYARTPGPRHRIGAVRESPEILIEDPKKDLKSFTVRQSANAGTKRGQGRGSFVDSVLVLIDSFYEAVLQNVKPWAPPAPTVKSRGEVAEELADEGISGELPSINETTFDEPEGRNGELAEIRAGISEEIELNGAESERALTERHASVIDIALIGDSDALAEPSE